MEKLQVSAKVSAKGDQKELGPATAYVNAPESLDEAVEMFGPDPVLSNSIANWKVTIQSSIRAMLRKGVSEEEIQKTLENAKMGVATSGPKVDPQAAFIAKFRSSTPEQQAQMLADLQAAAANG